MPELRSVPAPGGRRMITDCAILFADVAGYSAMMQRDEGGTLEFILACSQLVRDAARRFGGELVQTTGDGYLVLFAAPADAVRFGVDLHRILARRQAGQRQPAQLRVGIHSGRVHRLDQAVHRHAVNVAARLQQQARPGTCTVSAPIRAAARDLPGLAFQPLGQPALKNITETIAAYRLTPPGTAPAAGGLRIAVLDGIGASAGGPRMALDPARPEAALLGYLALVPGMHHPTGKITRLLDRPRGENPAAFIDSCGARLREWLGPEAPDWLFRSADHVALNELQVESDLGQCLNHLRRGEVPARLLRSGDWPARIMDGSDAIGPLFASWRQVTASAWRNRVQAALADLLHALPPTQAACRDAARALLALEPGNEAASERLMRHLAETGDRAAALAEFDRLCRHLARRHGIRPSGAAAALGRSLRAGTGGAGTGAGPGNELGNGPGNGPGNGSGYGSGNGSGGGSGNGPGGAAGGRPARFPRIVVAPFDPAPAALAPLVTGFRRELLAALSRFREWSVIDGAELNADPAGAASRQRHHYTIGARVQDGAAALLQLWLSEHGQHRVIWAEDIAIDPTRWQAAQQAILARVAAHLETYISADRIAHVIRDAPQDGPIFDAWLQAETIFARWTPRAAVEAERLLTAGLTRDPGFAPGYASLAGFKNVHHILRPGLAPDPARAQAADRLAARAVEMDPLHARNHLAVAWSAALTGAYDRAEIHLDLAASLNPNCPGTVISCALGRALLGQPGRAAALVDHAGRISPMLSPYQWRYVASVHVLGGRFEAALRAGQLAENRIHDNQGWVAAALARLGRRAEARRAFERMVAGLRPSWVGPAPLTEEAAFDWFIAAYPLRRQQDRNALADALRMAMAPG